MVRPKCPRHRQKCSSTFFYLLSETLSQASWVPNYIVHLRVSLNRTKIFPITTLNDVLFDTDWSTCHLSTRDLHLNFAVCRILHVIRHHWFLYIFFENLELSLIALIKNHGKIILREPEWKLEYQYISIHSFLILTQ